MSHRVISNRERGSALVELVLCISLFWIPLFFGTAIVGFSLIRAMQVNQVCRNAGHMYAYGTDFSQSSPKTILRSLSGSMDLSSTGNSFIVLSTITFVNAMDCQAAYPSSSSPTCANTGKYVLTKQVAIGNSSLGLTGVTPSKSAFGTPDPKIQDGSGGITPQNYMQASSALVTNFESITGLKLASTQVSYVAEMFARPLQPIFGVS